MFEYNKETKSFQITINEPIVLQFGVEKILDPEKGIVIRLWDNRQLN